MSGSRPVLAAVLLLSACGDGGRNTSTSPSNPTTNLVPAGTVLFVVSGETGAPVASAQIVLAGRTYQADASGRFSLPEAVNLGSFVDILASGFFDRQTLLRDSGGTRFTLWPLSSATGMNPEFTFEIVYTSAVTGNPQRMLRIRRGATEAYVVPSTPIGNDPVAMQVVMEAAEMMTANTGGEIRFLVADSAPAGAVAFDLTIDSGDPALRNAVAVAKRRTANSSITGGTVVYVTIETVRTSTTAHELGHMFGLEHSSGPDDVMSTERNRRRGTRRFSARESLAMTLMLQRPPGNDRPDNDRMAAVSTGLLTEAEGISVVVCER